MRHLGEAAVAIAVGAVALVLRTLPQASDPMTDFTVPSELPRVAEYSLNDESMSRPVRYAYTREGRRDWREVNLSGGGRQELIGGVYRYRSPANPSLEINGSVGSAPYVPRPEMSRAIYTDLLSALRRGLLRDDGTTRCPLLVSVDCGVLRSTRSINESDVDLARHVLIPDEPGREIHLVVWFDLERGYIWRMTTRIDTVDVQEFWMRCAEPSRAPCDF